jgi:hypothetical protein
MLQNGSLDDDQEEHDTGTAADEGQHSQRVRRILETRQSVIDRRTEIQAGIVNGAVSRQRGARLYRSVLESHLLDLEASLSRVVPELWHERAIYEFTTPIFLVDDSVDQRDRAAPHKTSRQEQRDHVTQITGIGGLLDLETPIQVEHQVWRFDRDSRRCDYHTQTRAYQMPVDGLDRVFRASGVALEEVGLDLEIGDNGTPTWGTADEDYTKT